MLNKPLTISLVIPVWNEERYLAACLRSALAQEVPFDEIIIVDNNSSDASARIGQQFDGVRILHEATPGIVFARDRGFGAATSEVIARIDADTLLPVDWSKRILEFYSDQAHNDTAWTSGGTFRDTIAPRFIGWSYRLMAFYANRLLTGYPTLWGSSMAITRAQWQLVSSNVCRRNDIHEDLDLATHLYQRGVDIKVDSTLLVSAEVRRVWNGRRALWNYLQWWPRTLRVHRQKAWLLCWLIGTVPLFVATALLPRPLQNYLQRQSQVPRSLEV